MVSTTQKVTKVTAIRAPTDDTGNHTVVLRQLKEVVEMLLGVRGDPNNRSVTLGELVQAGIVTSANGQVLPPGLYPLFEPTSLTATPIGGGIQFQFSAPANSVTGAEFELLEYTSSTPYESASVVWTGTSNTFDLAKTDTITRYYWIRTVLPTGQRSFPYPASPASPTAAGVPGTGGTLDNILDGSSYAKVLGAGLSSGVVNTNGIVANGVSQTVSAVNASPAGVGYGIAEDVNVLSASITTGGNPVGIDANMTVIVDNEHMTPNSPMLFYIDRDGSQVGTASFDVYQFITNNASSSPGPLVGWVFQVALSVMDTPAAGSHTYSIHWHCVAGTAGASPLNFGVGMSNAAIKVREYMR